MCLTVGLSQKVERICDVFAQCRLETVSSGLANGCVVGYAIDAARSIP